MSCFCESPAFEIDLQATTCCDLLPTISKNKKIMLLQARKDDLARTVAET
jgi:hypothetical protein